MTAPISLLAIPVVAMGILIGGQPSAVSATAMTTVGFDSTPATDSIPVDPAAPASALPADAASTPDPSTPDASTAPQTTDPTASPPAPTTPDPTATPSPTTPDPTPTPSPTTSARPPVGPSVDPPVSRPTYPQVKRAAAARLAAFTAALARLTSASRTYDAAKLAYASVKAEHDAALHRATLVHGLATGAARTAAASHRAAAAMVLALAQQQGGDAALNELLNGPGGGNLLSQLGTLDKLSDLADGLTTVLAQADVDQKRADRLSEQDAAAQLLVDTIPVDTAFGVMASAEAEFDRATASVEALRISSDSLIRLTLPPVISDNGQLSAQGWTTPAVGVITDGFGPRPNLPLPGVSPFHYGTDIDAACGAGIYAATSGIVEAVGRLGTYGNWILIDHGDGIETGYAHISTGSTLVAVGESVLAGQVIAGVGSTGVATGCHLHFEVRINGTRIDPQPFMLARGVTLGGN